MKRFRLLPTKPTQRRHPGSSLRWLCFVLWIFSHCAISAFAEDAKEAWQFTQISIEQGLSQSTVNCIYQDRYGFLWFCTQNGLNRFDGYEIETYRRDSERLHHEWIATLAEDADGNLWIGTEGGGLSSWNLKDGSTRHFRHDPQDPQSIGSDRIRTITIARDQTLWIGTIDFGLSRFDPQTANFVHYAQADDGSGPRDGSVRAILETSSGDFWIGTKHGVDIFDPEKETFEEVDLAHPQSDATEQDGEGIEVLALLEDKAGRIWIGTENGLALFQPETEQIRWFFSAAEGGTLTDSRIRTLFEDQEGRLWVGTYSGLNLWDEVRQGFRVISTAEPGSQTQDQIFAIHQDRNGNMWIGTFTRGALRWNPRSLSFQLYKGASGTDSTSDSIFSIQEDQDGYLWLGSFGGGLTRLDRQKMEPLHFNNDPDNPESLSDNRVTALLVDADDNLWVGTFAGGLNKLKPGSNRFTHLKHEPQREDSLSARGVTTLLQDAKDQIWVGTYGGGLNKLVDTETFLRYSTDPVENGLSNDRILAMVTGEPNQIWIATDGGLNLLNIEDETFSHWLHEADNPQSISSSELYTLHYDTQGRLWIGTKSSGLDLLTHLEGKKATFRNYSDGLPDPTIWGIESDSLNRLWLATTNGLVRFNPETEEIRIYDTTHGLQSREFNLGAHFKSPSGELFFGGVNGVNAFFPEQIRDNTVPPNVVLTRFTKLNEAVDLGVPLTSLEYLALDHSDHYLSFEFAALDFTAPEKNRYRYQLEGFEDRWVDMQDRRVHFTYLNPGSFTLKVQGSNSDGVWSPLGKEIAIDVAPPLWRTWWFRSLVLIFAAATATGAHQLKIHRIRVNNERLAALVKERTRELEDAQERLVRKEKLAVLGELSGSVAHELRNPLGIIKNSIYFLRLTQKMVDDKAKEHLSLIDREIKRSDRIIGELLDYAKEPTAQTEPVPITQVIDASLDLLDVPESIELKYDADTFLNNQGEPLKVQVDQGQIERVLGNLLTNAFQAMPDGGTLHIEGEDAQADVWLRITDTGVGIEEEDLQKIFEPLFTRKIYGIGLGLPLSLRYVHMNGGKLTCDSEVDKGTTFHIHLPKVKNRGANAAASS